MKIKHSIHVPAGAGKGFTVRKGDLIRITDLRGQQPVDFWALNKRDTIERLYPHQGDAAYTTHRRPIMCFRRSRICDPGRSSPMTCFI